ncbi:hypothetical protein [Methylobacterium sp. 22177]|uniref:hypothetical protein n=1 Tax=Methylobacterium sp. 22177 TaxID=3453885 RepID=UPI003F8620E9
MKKPQSPRPGRGGDQGFLEQSREMEHTSGPPGDQVDRPQNDSFIDVENRLRVKRYEVEDQRRSSRNFPRQRVGALSKIVRHRHEGPCETDDGETYFDLVAPFLVQASAIEGGDPVAYVMGWAQQFVPALVREIGPAGIEARVSAMVRQHEEARRSGARWAPGMKAIVSALRLTLEEVRAVGLRGFGSVNPPSADDVKARKRNRATEVRRERGMTAQSDRTRTKCDDAIAAAIGLKSRRMIQKWRKDQILDAKLAPFIEAGILDYAKLCPPSSGEHGRHTFANCEPAMNDNAQLARSA